MEGGWLIERSAFRGRGPTYLIGPIKHSDFPEMYAWTAESAEAIRFYREKDAKQVMTICGLDRFEDIRVTEHGWAQMNESSKQIPFYEIALKLFNELDRLKMAYLYNLQKDAKGPDIALIQEAYHLLELDIDDDNPMSGTGS